MADNRYRLEGNTRAEDVRPGLRATIGDPLWMLARQWQVGEFRGEDAASPIQVRYQIQTTTLSGYQAADMDSFVSIPHQVPSESLVERIEQSPLASFHRSAQAGIHLIRLLREVGFVDLPTLLQRSFALQVPDLTGVPAAEHTTIRLLAQRGCDGDAIYAARRSVLKLMATAIDASEQRLLETTFAAWVDWYEAQSLQPVGDAWDEERLEYRFNLAAQGTRATIVLEASEYPGGHLDWYSFDRSSTEEKIKGHITTNNKRTVLPAPVAFAGMAASRWWQFEDGTVNFGDLTSATTDFTRMISAAFATTFGDDWYVVPARVPIGSLARVMSFTVVDTFGDEHDIKSIAENDGPERNWRFFELQGAEDKPFLCMPAVALGRYEGQAREHVALYRDETENMAWGIEEIYESPLERRIERRLEWQKGEQAADDALSSDLWTYRLLTPIPPHWIPFVPRREEGSAQIRLTRARMAEWALLPAAQVGIRGAILLPDPGAPLSLYEEEIPASGIDVTSSYQMVRDPRGGRHIWFGRRKRPAKPRALLSRDTDKVDIR